MGSRYAASRAHCAFFKSMFFLEPFLSLKQLPSTVVAEFC